MTDVVLSAQDAKDLVAHVTGGATELCAVLLSSQHKRADGGLRLLVREVIIPSSQDYSRVGRLEAELKPEFVARVTKQAKLADLGIVFVHSHPGDHAPRFSHIDDAGETHLAGFMARRHAGRTHLALVISKGGMCCRELGSDKPVRVISVGADREVLYTDGPQPVKPDPRHDRQVRAFGPEGQAAIEQLCVAIVGLGGTGSIVAQELGHLGVRKFILVDPDVVDETNLNRIAGASASDIGRSKVDVAERLLKSIRPEIVIKTVNGNIVHERHARPLLDADFIFGCTDSHGSRAVIQQISYQYLIPCIDVGSTIAVRDGAVTHIVGRVQTLAPGLGCFTCGNLLDPVQVRHDMMSDAERKQDPYFQGAHQPAPAVMSLNGTISSLSVTMFLSYVVHIPSPARHLIYDAMGSRLRSVRIDPQANCFQCSRTGGYARGDSWPLNVRHD